MVGKAVGLFGSILELGQETVGGVGHIETYNYRLINRPVFIRDIELNIFTILRASKSN